jgi:hypothetical protein
LFVGCVNSVPNFHIYFILSFHKAVLVTDNRYLTNNKPKKNNFKPVGLQKALEKSLNSYF